MILLHCLETVRPALSYSGVPTQSFILRGASPKVREHGRTMPVAYELASDTYYRLGVVTEGERSCLLCELSGILWLAPLLKGGLS